MDQASCVTEAAGRSTARRQQAALQEQQAALLGTAHVSLKGRFAGGLWAAQLLQCALLYQG